MVGDKGTAGKVDLSFGELALPNSLTFLHGKTTFTCEVMAAHMGNAWLRYHHRNDKSQWLESSGLLSQLREAVETNAEVARHISKTASIPHFTETLGPTSLVGASRQWPELQWTETTRWSGVIICQVAEVRTHTQEPTETQANGSVWLNTFYHAKPWEHIIVTQSRAHMCRTHSRTTMGRPSLLQLPV